MEKLEIKVDLRKKILSLEDYRLALDPSFFSAEVNKVLNAPGELALTLSYNAPNQILENEIDKFADYLSRENKGKNRLQIYSTEKQKGVDFPKISLVGYIRVQINSG